MGRKYTRTETIAQIEEAAKDMSTFYTATCIRRTGTTYKADGARYYGARYYTEIISEYLLEHYDLFNQIQKIKRGNYKIGSHNGTTPRETSNRKEERIALALAQKKVLNPLGEVIDYQVPLKSKQSDRAGKIDLMTFDESTGILRLIELKAPKSKETLLRCVLEIYTYYKTVDMNELLRSYGLDGKCKEVRICPLFFKGSTQNNEYNTLGNRRNLVGLMDKISDDGVKVELLRFPFENIETVSPSTSYANGVTGCDTPCTPGAIVIIPTVKSPNAAPLDLEEVPDCDTGTPSKLEIEILDY